MDAKGAKNLRIKEAGAATKEKRKLQICKVVELKIDESKLNQKEKETLKMFFVEAKWIYNHILNQEDVFKYDYKTNPIQKRNKDGVFEDVVLKYLLAKNKQGIIQELQQNIYNLSQAKKKGMFVGRLKYISNYNSIGLSQYGITHRIVGNRFKINGIKRKLKVHGLPQITEGMEFANAKLLNKPNGYYIKLTTYQFPSEEASTSSKRLAVGLDFGIKDNIVTSEGERFNVSIAETDRLKRLQRRFAKAKKGSNNRYKLKRLVDVEYQKLNNKKADAINKIVSKLLTNYHHIFLQDENISGWKSSKMKGWGRKIQHSCMGAIKVKLSGSSQVTMLDRFVPTTKLCHECGIIGESIPLEVRIFTCTSCGYTEDRDIKAAKTIRKLGLIGTGHTEFKPVEKQRPKLNRRLVSMKQEALGFLT